MGSPCCKEQATNREHAPEPYSPSSTTAEFDECHPGVDHVRPTGSTGSFRRASRANPRLNFVVKTPDDEDARCFFVAVTMDDFTNDDSVGLRPSLVERFETRYLTLERLAKMSETLKCTDFSHEVLQRVFDKIERDPEGNVTLTQFMRSVQHGPASATLRNLIHKFRLECSFGFSISENYDYSKSTNDNYKTSMMTFFGEFKNIREERDYGYHVNYTETRQAWQDAVINSIIARTVKQAAPWLVYTCGPMGVGKGYALDWMSKQGIFPLEAIVHVDPDGFKLMMPEWPHYTALNSEEAGTLCHMESCYMMEVAQEAAMQRRQNIWIDGSLRNADFYANQFQETRQRYPHYKIAIFYVTAPEATIRERIWKRAQATGRDVPEHLIVASLGAMDRSLNHLTPFCNFVARINNAGATPLLTAFETIDRAGSWEAVRARFARTSPDAGEFPNALAPHACVTMPNSAGVVLSQVEGRNNRVKLVLQNGSNAELKSKVRAILPSNAELVISPSAEITLPECERRLAAIHPGVVSFFWIYPFWENLRPSTLRSKGFSQNDLDDPLVHLLQRGGYAYLDKSGKTAQLNVITNSDTGDGYIQFGQPKEMESMLVSALLTHCGERFQSTPLRYREARAFAWLLPGEVVQNVNVGGDHGAFAFHICDDSRSRSSQIGHQWTGFFQTVKSSESNKGARVIVFPVIH